MTLDEVDFGKDNYLDLDLDLDLSPRWLVDADLAVVTLPNSANDSVGEDDKEIEQDMSQGCDLVYDPKCDHDRHLGKEDSVEPDKVMRDFVSEGDLDLGPEGDPSHGIVCVEQGLNCDLDPNGSWLSLKIKHKITRSQSDSETMASSVSSPSKIVEDLLDH